VTERFFLLFVDGLGEAKYEVPEFVKRGKAFPFDGKSLVQNDNMEFFVDQAANPGPAGNKMVEGGRF